MGFIAGLLLLYMSEEDAFWFLSSIAEGSCPCTNGRLVSGNRYYLGITFGFPVVII